MKTLPESPLLLPIKTKVFIEKKNAYIDHILLNPTESTDKLYEIVKNYLSNLQDEITDMGDGSFYIIRKNFENDMNSEIIEKMREIRLNPHSKIITTGLLPGEVLVFKGNYVLKSEAPRECITYEFEKVKGTNVIYFSCETCKLNCKF
jgi:hypothetical protein